MPVDDCVNTISGWLDSAAARLPERITERKYRTGKSHQAYCLSRESQTVVMAASPLFNGNPDYASFKDKDGVALFNPTFDANKWVKARDAAKAAMESAETNNFSLISPIPTMCIT